jgi:hypothetical protein
LCLAHCIILSKSNIMLALSIKSEVLVELPKSARFGPFVLLVNRVKPHDICGLMAYCEILF